MRAREITPCGVLFHAMKKRGGISYKELASLVLSGRPLSGGRSPVSRINDRTWISRFVVHAPVESVQDGYFCNFSVSALRIVARLKSREGRAFSNAEVLDIVTGEDGKAMERALSACHQDVSLYRNVLERLTSGTNYTADERAEIAMVLFVAAGCSADVKRASLYAVDFMRSINGGGLATPAVVLINAERMASGQESVAVPRSSLGLLRVVGGFVVGGPHWISSLYEGVEIGAIVFGDESVTDVGSGVSGRHARVWCSDEGCWYIEGLDSRNGTLLVSGANREQTVVEPPRDDREGFESKPIELRPGDELVLAEDTTFAVIEGFPNAL